MVGSKTKAGGLKALKAGGWALKTVTAGAAVAVTAGARLPLRLPVRVSGGQGSGRNKIKPLAGEIEVRKTRTGAFSTTDLHEQLKAKGIDTLILAGVSTSGAVLSTVRYATDKDYRYVVEKCTTA